MRDIEDAECCNRDDGEHETDYSDDQDGVVALPGRWRQAWTRAIAPWNSRRIAGARRSGIVPCLDWLSVGRNGRRCRGYRGYLRDRRVAALHGSAGVSLCGIARRVALAGRQSRNRFGCVLVETALLVRVGQAGNGWIRVRRQRICRASCRHLRSIIPRRILWLGAVVALQSALHGWLCLHHLRRFERWKRLHPTLATERFVRAYLIPTIWANHSLYLKI